MPSRHLDRLAAAAAPRRVGDPDAAPVETLVVPAASTPGCTRTRPTARPSRGFLADALGGPLAPEAARPRRRGDAGRAHPRRGGAVRGRGRDAGRLPDARPGRPARARRGSPADVAADEPTSAGRADRRRPAVADDRRVRVWDGRSRRKRVDPQLRGPSAGAGAPRADPARRPARRQLKNQQRWAFIVCRDRDHLARARGGRAVRRPPRRGGGRRSPS